MKYLKIAGLCLVSMLAMGMALAGNAAAAPLWLLCLEGSGLTKYSGNQCTEALSTGKWQSLGIAAGVSDTVRLLAFSLRLSDSKTGVTVRCPDVGTSWGLIEGTNKGQIKVAESKSPEAEGCTLEGTFLTCKAGKLESLQGANLPWATEMFETESKVLTAIAPGSSGKPPGWTVKCGGASDECVEENSEREYAELTSVVSKGVLLVLAKFENKRKGKCTIGGTKSGEVAGQIAILLWNGNGLSINTA